MNLRAASATRTHRGSLVLISLLVACGGRGDSGLTDFGTATAADTSDAGDTGDPSATGNANDTGQGSDTGQGGLFDVGAPDTEGGSVCDVADQMDAFGPCTETAPPDSFEPAIQWSWPGEIENQVVATPLVANLTDDDGNGEIDLCDVPDIVVVAYTSNNYFPGTSYIYVLDGETGAVHYKIAENVAGTVNPAIGDIDGDGLPEIVTAVGAKIGAFEHDGTLKWIADQGMLALQKAVALADLDADGDVEIMIGDVVYDHEGTMLWNHGDGSLRITTAADLDDDDDLEVIVGGKAYHHDGSLYFDSGIAGNPQVADLDDDGLPEILVITFNNGAAVLEHDGTVKISGQSPNLVSGRRPAAIHDMDGDDAPEIATGSSNKYSVFEADLTPVWSANVWDGSGNASSTAFDFLGDGSAEAMYADETRLFVFGPAGEELLTTQRTSWTQLENPVVADVDNDGSAEIVVISNTGYDEGMSDPVQVVRDVDDRWIGARRIWNQHAYHVTNVREDSTIPQFQPKNWQTLNTFRTQAQLEGGKTCIPEG